jgi:hypothetical protein
MTNMYGKDFAVCCNTPHGKEKQFTPPKRRWRQGVGPVTLCALLNPHDKFFKFSRHPNAHSNEILAALFLGESKKNYFKIFAVRDSIAHGKPWPLGRTVSRAVDMGPTH